jgi:hypothetical protein
MRLLLLLALLISGPLHAQLGQAQVTQVELQARLQHKVLYLRGLYEADSLKFDPAGVLLSHSAQINPMRSAIQITKVEMKQDHLSITGKRLAVAFTDHQFQAMGTGETAHIDIAASPDGDYGPAVDAIFASNLSELAPTTPGYWLPCLTDAAPALSKEANKSAGDRNVVDPPVALYVPVIKLDEHARGHSVNAELTVALIVDSCGNPAEVHLLAHYNDEVDKAVLECVQGYRFKAAKRNGIPIPVRLNVQIHVNVG